MRSSQTDWIKLLRSAQKIIITSSSKRTVSNRKSTITMHLYCVYVFTIKVYELTKEKNIIKDISLFVLHTEITMRSVYYYNKHIWLPELDTKKYTE